MPPEVEPPELARLLDYAERPRTGDWSLRAALVRYAQPEPVRVSALLEQVRRIDAALPSHADRLERQGPAVWAAVAAEGPTPSGAEALVALLGEAAQLDRLGDALAAWAEDRSRPRPDGEVDEVVRRVAARLDALGVAREEREGPPPRRGRAARGA